MGTGSARASLYGAKGAGMRASSATTALECKTLSLTGSARALPLCKMLPKPSKTRPSSDARALAPRAAHKQQSTNARITSATGRERRLR